MYDAKSVSASVVGSDCAASFTAICVEVACYAFLVFHFFEILYI